MNESCTTLLAQIKSLFHHSDNLLEVHVMHAARSTQRGARCVTRALQCVYGEACLVARAACIIHLLKSPAGRPAVLRASRVTLHDSLVQQVRENIGDAERAWQILERME